MSKTSSTLSARQRREQHTQEERRKQRLTLVLGGAALLALAAVIVISLTRQPTVGLAPEIAQESADYAPPNTLGPAAAPIQIVEFGDFGCPACRSWHNAGVWEQLQAQYGDQISLTFRHFPVITRQSPQAAEAAQCAADQGLFWPYHDYLYEQAQPGALNDSHLKSYAALLGLDTATFNACLDGGKYTTYVTNELREAQLAGAQGTPSFFINGIAVSSSPAQLSATIDRLLEN